ncbi:hypothetical protein [Blastopirellula marina]|uniref:Uncharacterized protein n=1 Tax=Blastopirellula marina TaxID=124 RepID=A0A2S8GP77_9BACT|nr:hypothetical protein [Blastopirellula marina]PQO46230.1 hypothetical protein C5Y93_09600 [Blastopirellula marina]
MDETKAYALINKAVHYALAVDVLLIFWALATKDTIPLAICAGMFLAQGGLCCAAYLRNDNMREEAIVLFEALVFVAFLGAAFVSSVSAGYVLLAFFLATSLSLMVFVVPVWLLQLLLGRRRPQFSILKMMIVTAVIAILAALARWGGDFSLFLVVAALVVVLICLPSALACWLVNFIQRTTMFVTIMLVVSTLLSGLAFWLDSFNVEPMTIGFLLAQTFGSTIGGTILLQVRPSPDLNSVEVITSDSSDADIP